MMTSAQVVQTSVNVTSNSPSQDYTHPDDHNLPTYERDQSCKRWIKWNRVVQQLPDSLAVSFARVFVITLQIQIFS